MIFKPSFHGSSYNISGQHNSFELLVDMVSGNPKIISLFWLVNGHPKTTFIAFELFDSFMVHLKPLVFGQLETVQLNIIPNTSGRFCV